MNIACIGPRGVGKSKISRKLSKMTGYSLLSTDMIAIYKLGGTSIADFVKQQGWVNFRNLEYKILKSLKNANNIILDCGGGIIFDVKDEKEIPSKKKIKLLKSNYTIISLSRPIPELITKVEGDKTRPSLSKIDNYESILSRRLPIYKKCSHFHFDLESMDTDEICRMILKKIEFSHL